jgi:predicted nucleic acid-binding Zn ribbon protein
MRKSWRDREPRSTELSAVGDVLSGLLAERVLAQGVTIGRLVKQWPDVVGERLAIETAPARLEGGVLTVWVSTGPWGAQVRFLAEDVRKGANRTLGSEVVKAIRVTVRPDANEGPKPL